MAISGYPLPSTGGGGGGDLANSITAYMAEITTTFDS